MQTAEKQRTSGSRREDMNHSKRATIIPNRNKAARPKHEAPQKVPKPNYALLWATIKKHALSIATAIITLIESCALIIDLFSSHEVEQSSGLISSKMAFPLLLYITAVIIAIISLLICIVLAAKEYSQLSKTVFSEYDKAKIDDYLSHFIESGDSAVVLSHDMSWISDKNWDMLAEKARNHELQLFLPHETEKVKELENLGAEVRYFGNIIGDPMNSPVASRMTLINWNRVYTKLTYPTKNDGLHINYEFSAGEPANQLAQDLIRLLAFVSDRGTERASIDSVLNEYNDHPSDDLYYRLGFQDRARIMEWYTAYSKSGVFSIHGAFDLMCDLQRYEDIDLKPDLDYTRIKERICMRYHIDQNVFLKMYSDFRKLLQL